MEIKYLLDTNTVIYFLSGINLDITALKKLDSIIRDGSHISIITKLELLGYNFSDEQSEILTKRFTDNSIIYQINSDVQKETIRIRKSSKIKLADAIIAATALANQFTLLTANIADFNNLHGLKIESPFDLK